VDEDRDQVDEDRRQDDRFMDEAFALAERGRGRTHPNPLVGAVLVRDGAVVGRAWHPGPGEPHAEVSALRDAGDDARGATLYCTLEPCAHQGRTPPCADAIVAAGVSRVVAALRDPNPLVDGRGFARLRAAGVAVDTGGGRWEARARAQNAAFVKAVRTGLPLVTIKAAVSLDGKVAAAGGDARWISGEESRRRVHAMRAAADAVMVGAETVRRDDPELTVRMVGGRDPVRVVVSGSGTVPLDRKLVATAREVRTIVLAEAAGAATRRDLEARGVEVVETGEGGLRRGLEALAERDLFDVLCEGGPGLTGSLVGDGLADRLALFVAPLLVGRGAPDLLAAPAVTAIADATRLTNVSWEAVGDDLLLRGDVPPRPAAGKAGG
jgi:diaminohydroxyphosphoribosylaminopyrimidine deaminase/5-amino-6-(5-phosphoribosylamino)uracil reductase